MEQTTVYSQRQRFRLISDRVVQKGPAFPQPLEMSVDGTTGEVKVSYQDEQRPTPNRNRTFRRARRSRERNRHEAVDERAAGGDAEKLLAHRRDAEAANGETGGHAERPGTILDRRLGPPGDASRAESGNRRRGRRARAAVRTSSRRILTCGLPAAMCLRSCGRSSRSMPAARCGGSNSQARTGRRRQPAPSAKAEHDARQRPPA